MTYFSWITASEGRGESECVDESEREETGEGDQGSGLSRVLSSHGGGARRPLLERREDRHQVSQGSGQVEISQTVLHSLREQRAVVLLSIPKLCFYSKSPGNIILISIHETDFLVSLNFWF